MSKPTPQEKARDAIYEGIAKQAAERAADRDPDVLAKLADAYSKVAFGPQGGENRRDESVDYRYVADYHNTDHQGEDRPRPRAGFGG